MGDKDKKRACGKAGGDIGPGARSGKGITIHGNVNIGENVIVRQNTSTGEKPSDGRENYIVTGDNIDTGARACIPDLM
ncbi:TPA: hypothetical protein ACP2IW_004778 [Escherichia coli]